MNNTNNQNSIDLNKYINEVISNLVPIEKVTNSVLENITKQIQVAKSIEEVNKILRNSLEMLLKLLNLDFLNKLLAGLLNFSSKEEKEEIANLLANALQNANLDEVKLNELENLINSPTNLENLSIEEQEELEIKKSSLKKKKLLNELFKLNVQNSINITFNQLGVDSKLNLLNELENNNLLDQVNIDEMTQEELVKYIRDELKREDKTNEYESLLNILSKVKNNDLVLKLYKEIKEVSVRNTGDFLPNKEQLEKLFNNSNNKLALINDFKADINNNFSSYSYSEANYIYIKCLSENISINNLETKNYLEFLKLNNIEKDNVVFEFIKRRNEKLKNAENNELSKDDEQITKLKLLVDKDKNIQYIEYKDKKVALTKENLDKLLKNVPKEEQLKILQFVDENNKNIEKDEQDLELNI